MTNPNPSPDAASGSGPRPSGVDLARVALHNARQSAKARGEHTTRKPKRPRSTQRRDGRDPTGLADVLKTLMADRGWNTPTAGGTILDQWPTIAATVDPTLPHHTQAVAYHPQTQQLDIRPDSPAYATQLRLNTPRIITTANHTTGTTTVRDVHVLPIGTLTPPHTPPGPPDQPADPPPAPIKTRQMGSPGYQQARAAHQATSRPQHHDPLITAAIARQNHAIQHLSHQAFENEQNEQAAQHQTETTPAPADTTDPRAAALRRARAERAKRTST